jgi:membrane protein YdbS with pleckstrin-like domain
MNELTQQGIEAVRAGDKSKARQLLRSALRNDSQDVQAWLWLSAVVETNQERIECLQQVLRIDPNNQAAAKGIAQLIAKGTASVQINKVQSDSQTEASPAIAVTGQQVPEIYSGGARDIGKTGLNENQEIFSVHPSLTPTLIGSGISFIVIALLVLIFVGPFISMFYNFGEKKAASTLLCVITPLFLLLLYPVIRRIIFLLSTSYTLTPRHLIVESGILSKNHKTIPVQRIQDVAYRQSFLERIFGIGDVIVESAGEWGSIHLTDLADCKMRTQQILTIIHREDR